MQMRGILVESDLLCKELRVMFDQSDFAGAKADCIRVLVAEDEPSVSQVIKVHLSRFQDLQVVGTAENGVEAIELCCRLNPHVVVMDYMMPVMDGITATRAIRQQNPNIQIVIFSAAYDRRLVEWGKQAGAFSYLTKENLLKGLVESIRAAHGAGAQPAVDTINQDMNAMRPRTLRTDSLSV